MKKILLLLTLAFSAGVARADTLAGIPGTNNMSATASRLVMVDGLLEWLVAPSNLVAVQNTVILPRTNLGTTRLEGDVTVVSNLNVTTMNVGTLTVTNTPNLWTVLARTVPVTITNDMTETTVLDYTIPASALSTNRVLVFEVSGWTMSGTAATTVSNRIYFGTAVASITNVTSGFGPGTGRRPFFYRAQVISNGSPAATNSNAIDAFWPIGTGGSSFPFMGLVSGTALETGIAGQENAIDTTTNVQFKVTFANGTNAAQSTRFYSGTLTLK